MKNKEKLELILSTLCNNNQSAMSKKLGMTPAGVNTWLKRDSIDYDRVAAAFPEISAEWLLRGEGAMLKADCAKSNCVIDSTNTNIGGTQTISTDPSLRDLYESIKKKDQQIEKLIDLLTSK